MESITSAELSELLIQFSEFMDNQIEYWLSISFAVIAASFLGATKLTKKKTTIITYLYLLATLIFFFKYIGMIIVSGQYRAELISRGISWDGLYFLIFIGRIILFFAGSYATLWFLKINEVKPTES